MSFLERKRDLSLDIRAAHREARTRARSMPAAFEEGLEKIAESAWAAPFPENLAEVEAAARAFSGPAGRWREVGSRLPVRSQLIIALALLRIRQDFIGLIDLFEFLLGRLVSRIH